eukprot:c5671_g1_i2.p1 GENE.c5671_g1_i2~~c5671_g1_i2.p1  ORF type:complete len:148 (+),score=22.94 c5671_g1_i2:33-446(+)
MHNKRKPPNLSVKKMAVASNGRRGVAAHFPQTSSIQNLFQAVRYDGLAAAVCQFANEIEVDSRVQQDLALLTDNQVKQPNNQALQTRNTLHVMNEFISSQMAQLTIPKLQQMGLNSYESSRIFAKIRGLKQQAKTNE